MNKSGRSNVWQGYGLVVQMSDRVMAFLIHDKWYVVVLIMIMIIMICKCSSSSSSSSSGSSSSSNTFVVRCLAPSQKGIISLPFLQHLSRSISSCCKREQTSFNLVSSFLKSHGIPCLIPRGIPCLLDDANVNRKHSTTSSVRRFIFDLRWEGLKKVNIFFNLNLSFLSFCSGLFHPWI